jgi:exodeoxyribonuclease V gamma subunit
VRYFIRNQLQISLREDGDDLALREPFALDALEQFKLGSELFEWVNGGVSHEQAYALVRGSGQLPHGLAGRIVFDDLMRSVVALSERVGELRGAQTTEHAPFDIDVAGVRLRGELTDLAPKGQVLARFAKLGGATELGAWIRHLVLQWVPPDLAATGRDTYLVGRPSRTEATIARFGEVESPEQKLAELVELFREGTKAPLPLFPKTSRAYAEATREDKEPDEALIKASTRFNEDHVVRGEGLDPYNVLAFKGVDPLDPGAELVGDRRFGELANLVFAPMLEARKVVQ